MPLKITLKPYERMIIAGAVLTNGNKGTDFFIENNVPLLRQKDIMSERNANSPARRIYFIIQLMYIDGKNLATHHDTYWKLVKEFLNAAPSKLGLIERISKLILSNNYYKALKLTRELINYEKEVLEHVQEQRVGGLRGC
jgi:flagellar protein FlbT